jgi:hypothetical protein
MEGLERDRGSKKSEAAEKGHSSCFNSKPLNCYFPLGVTFVHKARFLVLLLYLFSCIIRIILERRRVIMFIVVVAKKIKKFILELCYIYIPGLKFF